MIALAGVLLNSGCANNSSPGKVLHSFLQKIKDEDYDAAAKLATQNSQEVVKGLKKDKKQVTEEEIYADKKGINPEWTFELEKAKVTGDFATVIVTNKHDSEKNPPGYKVKYALEKENGDWKVMMIPTPRMIFYRDSDIPFNPVHPN